MRQSHRHGGKQVRESAIIFRVHDGIVQPQNTGRASTSPSGGSKLGHGAQSYDEKLVCPTADHLGALIGTESARNHERKADQT